jgi:hypothetical protein
MLATRSLLNQFQVEMEPRQSQPTDYGHFVIHIVKRLASSYLVTDTSTNSERGIQTWCTGFHRLVDIMVVLHSRGELELETVNEASKACSECWSVAGTWRGMEDCRQGVKEVAAKLKKLLDEPHRRTYKGSKVYTPSST